MARPTILAFNLTDSRISKLKFICMKLGTAVQPVPAVDFHQPVGALCGIAERTDTASSDTFDDEMIVFCHMDNALVNRFLTTCKQLRFAPVALKAILTPTNAAWTACQLHDELRQEREAVLKGAAADHNQ